jgi:hypothetical protein
VVTNLVNGQGQGDTPGHRTSLVRSHVLAVFMWVFLEKGLEVHSVAPLLR